MSVYFFAAFMLILASVTAILFRGRFEQALPCCIFYIILALYISGLFFNFLPGILVVILTLPIAGTICLLRSRKYILSDIRTYVLTPGFFFVLIAYGMMLPCIMKMRINSWDEFSHWGTVIKNFWYLNDFANLENSTTSFKGYPPAASLFAYFAQRIGGHYVECKSYAAYDFFYLALMAPYFTAIYEKKEWKKAIALGFCCILLPTIVWNRVYDVTYVDGLLGMEMALIFVAYLFYQDGKWRSVTIFLTTVVLCLTKASGAGLACISLLIIVIAEWCQTGKKGLSGKRSVWKIAGIMGGATILGKYSWDIYLKVSATKEAWDISDLNAANLWELLCGNGPAYRYESIHNFWHTVWAYPISDSILPMSCLAWLTVFIAIGIIIGVLVRKSEDRVRIKLCVWGLIAGVTVYAVSLLLLYLFTYGESEALSVASFGRYMGTYLVAIAAVLLVLLVKHLREKQKWGMIPVVLLMGMMSYLPVYKAFFTATPVCSDVYQEWPVDIRFQRVKERLDQCEGRTPKMYFVHQQDSGYWYWVCRYGITPYQVQTEDRPYSFDAEYDTWVWEQELLEGGYTHVLLNHLDKTFKENFGEMFASEEEMIDAGLYEIVEQDGRVRMEKAGEY